MPREAERGLRPADDKLAPRPIRLGTNKGKPTIDTEIPAWNPSLIEIAILGCHPDCGDIPEALALAVHRLRQAPDYLDALALPLPVHLAKLAQQYVLPTVPNDQPDDGRRRPRGRRVYRPSVDQSRS
jgi:hypothetical protein